MHKTHTEKQRHRKRGEKDGDERDTERRIGRDKQAENRDRQKEMREMDREKQ